MLQLSWNIQSDLTINDSSCSAILSCSATVSIYCIKTSSCEFAISESNIQSEYLAFEHQYIQHQNIYSRVLRNNQSIYLSICLTIYLSVYSFAQSTTIEIMTINIEETCRKLDVMTNSLKIIMTEQETIARKNYHREFDIFMSSLFVSDKYSEEEMMYKEDIVIYRDDNRFINNLKIRRNDDFQFKAKLVARYCFQDWTADWFFDLMKKLQNRITLNLDTLCFRICQKYEQKWRKKQQKVEQHRFIEQQQVEKVRIAKKRAKIFACRRCSVKFSSNTKFHQHIQNYHQKKIEKSASEIAKSTSSELVASKSVIVISTSFFTSKAMLVKITKSETAKSTSKTMIIMSTFFATSSSSSESTLMLTSSISQSESIIDNSFSMISSVTSIATSRKQIFWAEIVSRSIIASKSSRLSVSIFKIVSSIAKIASNICSSTSSSIFSRNSTSKHQKQKLYLIIDDLFRMFAERFKRTNLLRINDRIKKNKSSSKFFNQIKITFYFRFAVNQHRSISQNSKISNSRSFHQLMNAKTIRTIFNKWFEKSIISSYKISIFSRLFIFEIFSISSYKMSSISSFQSMIASCKFSIRILVSSISRVCFNISDSRRICRICSDIFESNNDLHRHLRAIHFDQATRRHRRWII